LQFTVRLKMKVSRIVRGPRATPILLAVLVQAELRAFRRIDTPKSDAGAMYCERGAIDDVGFADQVGRQSRATPNEKHERCN